MATSTPPKKLNKPANIKVGYSLRESELPENQPANKINSSISNLPVLGKLNEIGTMTST